MHGSQRSIRNHRWYRACIGFPNAESTSCDRVSWSRATPRRQRSRPTAPLVLSLVAALVTSGAASGHVVPVPQFLATGSVTTMSFAVPNERPEPMSGVTVSVPAGVRIVRAHPTVGWKATLDGSTATWRGGPLAHLAVETFRLDVDVSAPPGPVTLSTRELYPSGATVDWPATLTVVPGPDDERSESAGWGWIVAIAGVGLIFAAGLAALAWRRKGLAASIR